MAEGLGIQGQPVRVTILNAAGERRCRVNGSIRTATDETWTVDLIDPVPPLVLRTPVALEILVQGDLLWTTTWLRAETTGLVTTLHLVAPSTIHRGQRRAYPRVDLSLPVHIKREPAGELVAAQLRDLSAGGASFQAEGSLVVGEQVQLVLSLGSGFYFQNLKAEVVRGPSDGSHPRTFAVRFQCDEHQQALLAGWVARQLAGGVPAAALNQPER